MLLIRSSPSSSSAPVPPASSSMLCSCCLRIWFAFYAGRSGLFWIWSPLRVCGFAAVYPKVPAAGFCRLVRSGSFCWYLKCGEFVALYAIEKPPWWYGEYCPEVFDLVINGCEAPWKIEVFLPKFVLPNYEPEFPRLRPPTSLWGSYEAAVRKY